MEEKVAEEYVEVKTGKERERERGEPGSGAYWVKENKTCHLAKERR